MKLTSQQPKTAGSSRFSMNVMECAEYEERTLILTTRNANLRKKLDLETIERRGYALPDEREKLEKRRAYLLKQKGQNEQAIARVSKILST